ncbi:hypothetical protein Tco_1470715 [Tanacetum coccineum]
MVLIILQVLDVRLLVADWESAKKRWADTTNEAKPEVSMLGAYPMFVTDGTSSPLKSQQGLCKYASLSKEIKSL